MDNLRLYLLTPVILVMMILSSCGNELDITDESMTFNVFYKQSTFICYDVYPQYNGFEYFTFVATLGSLEKLSSVGLIDSAFATISEADICTKSKRTIIRNLAPGTEYFMCCVYLNADHRPIYYLLKKAFSTPAEDPFSTTFECYADRDTLVIHPSDATFYFPRCYSKKQIDTQYDRSPALAFYTDAANYSNYNLMDYFLFSGDLKVVPATEIPSLSEGDTICMLVSPYNIRTGYCPSPQIWYGVYREELEIINP